MQEAGQDVETVLNKKLETISAKMDQPGGKKNIPGQPAGGGSRNLDGVPSLVSEINPTVAGNRYIENAFANRQVGLR